MSNLSILQPAGVVRPEKGSGTNAWIRPLLMPLAIVLAAPSALAAQPGTAPSFILVDGKRYPVGELPTADAALLRSQPGPPSSSPSAPTSLLLPTSVDLMADQTEARNQGARDTCGTFATVAALEAVYKRKYRLTLDLSEQYLNHLAQSMSGLGEQASRDLPLAETWPGVIGGGGMGRPTAVLKIGVGVPPEASLPYIGIAGYQSAEAGDVPLFAEPMTQRALDDFNLSSEVKSYVFSPPVATAAVVLPQSALEQARYRPTSITFAPPSELGQLDWYKRQLAQKREVIFETRCCDGITGTPGETWTLPPGSSGGPNGHAMLMVGYDDARQAFRVKNSYGAGFGESGFVWISYNFVTQHAIYFAGVIDDVVPPSTPFDAFTNEQLFLGTWNLDFDGWKARLDIYNLPSQETATPVESRFLRLGTLFMPDGHAHRVNGTIDGNRLDFWVDWSAPDQPRWATRDAHFTTYLFSRDTAWMAGSLTGSDNNTFSIQASKNALPTGRAAPGPLRPQSYLGTWDVNFDGDRGRMEFLRVMSLPGMTMVVGRYTDSRGVSVSSALLVEPDPRKFALSISLPAPVVLRGYANGHEQGVLSATTTQAARTRGLVATRR